jgi:hypothetical protein
MLEDAVFRANPGYELCVLDRLDASERRPLRRHEEDADTYGVLRPRPGFELESRHASVDVALLFLTLSEPAPLPRYVRRRLRGGTGRVVTRLVLDGVLEMAHEDGYVSGARAAERMLPARAAGGDGRIGELSRGALRYAQALVDVPASTLAMRLYGYGARPLTPGLTRLVGGTSGIRGYLGIEPGRNTWAALHSGWEEVWSRSERRAYWLTFRARRPASSTDGAEGLWKLYVSPQVECVPAAVACVARALHGARGVKGFKVGADVSGLCRPDKLVVYFERLDDLQQAADMLRQHLVSCPAHGVPFTAAITQDGLLSWGVDPATRGPKPADVSWRLWIAERLGEYLAVGRARRDGDLEPWQFAIDRIGLDGVDPNTWAAVSALRHEAAGSM